MPGFRRRGDRIEVRLNAQQRRVVALALGILDSVDPGEDGDPAAARLAYRAHPDDPEANARFRSLTDGMLSEARRRDREAFAGSLAGASLERDTAEAWLRVVGEARLVLAARLGITDDGWDDGVVPETASPEMLLLELLGHVQDDLVRALMPR